MAKYSSGYILVFVPFSTSILDVSKLTAWCRNSDDLPRLHHGGESIVDLDRNHIRELQ